MTEQEQVTQKKEKKKVSEKLAKILDQIGRGFAKLDENIKKALRLGKEEGLTEKETGDLIREAMKKGGYTDRSIRNHLPDNAKHTEKRNKGQRCGKYFRIRAETEIQRCYCSTET